MQCSVAADGGIGGIHALAMTYIPSDSETARAIALILDCHQKEVPAWECWEALLAQHGHENFTHAPLNVALGPLYARLRGYCDFDLLKSPYLPMDRGCAASCRQDAGLRLAWWSLALTVMNYEFHFSLVVDSFYLR